MKDQETNINELQIDLGNPQRPLRIFSFGGGVQSHAVLFAQAHGLLPKPYDVYVFANVGNDSENPDTLKYIEDITKPFCQAHGIPFIETQRIIRKLGKVTLYQEIFRQQRSVIIPVRFPGKGFGNRNCTTNFKIRVIDNGIRKQNVPAAIVGLGISTDEFMRARDTNWHNKESDAEKARPLRFWKRREYPLLEMRFSRQDCLNLIFRLGHLTPPKSSCYWCPFKKHSERLELRRNRPDLFERAVAIEIELNKKRLDIGRDGVFLHPSCKPLAQAVGLQLSLFDQQSDDRYDSGHCFT